MWKVFAKQPQIIKPIKVESVKVESVKVVEVGKYYRVRANGHDDVIVRYEGIPKANHCKTCTCKGYSSYTYISGPETVGPIDITVLEEVNKPD